ncbi:enoyl-CoA hydratase [Diaphorobacter sp.]|uniref:enoyl-CoA hydratase n=1 Tax=Diaphorobacter sp. TaxID=1934310 RepID=UPI0028B07E79|nr:enoyl-CoA hydratase [Diaphorobacter sp.]
MSSTTSTADTVTLTLHDSGRAEITVDRPERHNAMTAEMYEALLAHIERVAFTPSVRCVSLRGAGGKSFISGTDITHFKDFTQGRQGLDYEAFVERVIDAVERISVPTIAVIDGWAVGGGLALAAACDFRICTPASRFGAPIAKTLSNTLSARNMVRLVAALGVPRVKRMLMLADYLSAEDMLHNGFVHAVVEQGALAQTASALAERLMALSGTTQAAVKESLRRSVVEQRLEDDDLVESVYGSAAFRSGVAAFIKP